MVFPTPREWVERQYNVVDWTDLRHGGHFLEWYLPDLVAQDVITALGLGLGLVALPVSLDEAERSPQDHAQAWLPVRL